MSNVKLSRQAVSERGGTTQYAEDEVNAALTLLATNGGRPTITSEQLKEEGIKVSREVLASWRDKQFPRRYHEIRQQLGKAISEDLADRATETAIEANQATREYVQQAVERMSEVDANHLAKNAQSLAMVMAQNIEKAELLRGKPTEIKKIDLEDALSTLEGLGVAKRRDVIDVTAEEIE